jgi:hypothetical protein
MVSDPVGADLSCTSPIHRPLVGFHDISPILLKSIFGLKRINLRLNSVGARAVKGGWVGLYGRPGVGMGTLDRHRQSNCSRQPITV